MASGYGPTATVPDTAALAHRCCERSLHHDHTSGLSARLSSTLRALSPPQRSHVVGARCPFKGFAHGTARHLRRHRRTGRPGPPESENSEAPLVTLRQSAASSSHVRESLVVLRAGSRCISYAVMRRRLPKRVRCGDRDYQICPLPGIFTLRRQGIFMIAAIGDSIVRLRIRINVEATSGLTGRCGKDHGPFIRSLKDLLSSLTG